MDEITIVLKLYSGIHKEIGLPLYDPAKGIVFNVKPGTRLNKVLKAAGFRKKNNYIYFSEGERIGIREKLKHSCEVACLKQSGGG